jgi:hypothetical protein
MSKFQFPDPLPIKTKADGDPITKNTIKVYKTRLNHIAAGGYTTVDELMNSAQEVIATINTIAGDADDDKARQVKRYYLSAIFYILPQDYLKKKNAYYEAFQKAKQNYVA